MIVCLTEATEILQVTKLQSILNNAYFNIYLQENIFIQDGILFLSSYNEHFLTIVGSVNKKGKLSGSIGVIHFVERIPLEQNQPIPAMLSRGMNKVEQWTTLSDFQ